MATLKELKIRRESIKSTQKITKAKQMVAAAKLRRAQAAAEAARPYAERLEGVVASEVSGKGYVLLFEGAGDLHGIDESDFDTLVSILDEANAEWKTRDVPFWAFLALRERDFAELED